MSSQSTYKVGDYIQSISGVWEITEIFTKKFDVECVLSFNGYTKIGDKSWGEIFITYNKISLEELNILKAQQL